jgi:hypothetical protein
MQQSKIPNLKNLFGFDYLVEYYNKYKDTDWKEWLDFDETFGNPGKQGLVGLLNLTKYDEKEHQECMEADIVENEHSQELKQPKIVFKVSQYINYLVQHEFTIMKGLNDIADFCPHFCKAVGSILCEIDPQNRKKGNPFDISCKHPIEKEILLTEYIEKSTKFYNYIRSEKIDDDIIYSTVKQVLMAISIAQRKKKFTHYDLHSYNVMMKKCDKDLVFLYVLDEENQFCVATNGHYPIIIDFGFSYISDLDNGPAYPSMAHTDVGFMSDRFDPFSDPKLFLVSVANDIDVNRKGKTNKKFKHIVKNIFGKLKLDWEAGWDETKKEGAANYVLDILEEYNDYSEVFKNYDYYCIDLIQSLIILPFEKQSYENIGRNYKVFLKEFAKIEKEIGNPFYNIYVLKGIVDVAREVRVDYLHASSSQKAVSYFSRAVFERIHHIAKYCYPKDIHYEKMLCSLICLAKNMEGIFYEVINKRMEEKMKNYSKLPVESVEEIFGIFETNIPDEYYFNSDTKVVVMNCIKEQYEEINLNKEDILTLNEIHPLMKGSYLYGLLEK